mgnify:CR=1 FL=1
MNEPWMRRLGALLAAAAALAGCAEKQDVAPQPRPVETVTLRLAEAADAAAYTGEVRARHENDLAFRVGGKVVERRVEVGAAVRAGRWAVGPDFCFGLQPIRELAGMTLAIVGTGAIGGAVARIAEGFGMRVLRAQVPGSATPHRVPLAAALAEADAVTLHCPLTPATARLVDASFLAGMKPGAVLINTGRGGLVDEAALAAALASGRLGAAALDVLDREPPPAGHPLLDPSAPWAGRLLVTPHLGWMSVEARARLVGEAVENLRAFLRGERRNRVG